MEDKLEMIEEILEYTRAEDKKRKQLERERKEKLDAEWRKNVK